MKYLLLITALWTCSCRPPQPAASPTDTATAPVVVPACDTLRLRDTLWLVRTDTVYRADPTQAKRADSLSRALFVSNYKLQRVRYYLKICLSNPRQDKFLKGWILRAIK